MHFRIKYKSGETIDLHWVLIFLQFDKHKHFTGKYFQSLVSILNTLTDTEDSGVHSYVLECIYTPLPCVFQLSTFLILIYMCVCVCHVGKSCASVSFWNLYHCWARGTHISVDCISWFLILNASKHIWVLYHAKTYNSVFAYLNTMTYT